MKKFITFFALAALVLVGCKKEIASGVADGDQTVTFSVVADNVATKAGDVTAIPDDIDRCLAVVRMYDANNQLLDAIYAKPEVTIADDKSKAEFSVDLMGGQKYQITVLMYTYGVYTVDGKLEAIERVRKNARNDAKLDMFSASITYQAGETTPLIIAKRPFAQLNLITTDLVENFEPTIALKYTAPKTFNAVTGEVSGTQVYETVGTYTSAYAPAQCTLSTDYIFASDEKSLISVEMKAAKVGTFVRTFDNLPLQRNYKTNVIGKLLSVNAPFTVQVNDNWYTPANDIQWQNAENIAAANAILAAATTGEDLNIKVNMPKDASAQKITFTSRNSNTNTTFKFENNFASESAVDKTITFTRDADATVMPASITVEAPAGTNLVFEKESHVVINGTDYGTITGSFTANTLVISEGVTVGTLTILKGGLEIHGTVNAVTAIAEGAEVIVRDCEGLSQEVYDELKAFIDSEYKAEQVDGKWNIFPKPAAAKIGDTKYATLAEAVTKATSGQTITLLADIEDAGSVSLPAGVILDGDNHKISGNSAIYINASGGGFIRNLNFENIHNTTVPSASDITKYKLPADKVGTLCAIYAEDLTGKVAVTDCTFDNIDWDAIQITPKDGCTIDIANNTFVHTNTETSQLRYVHIETASYIDAFVSVTDNKFYDSKNEFVISDLGVYKVRKSKTTKLSGNWLETISNYDMTYPEMIYPARSQADVDVDDICPAAKKVVGSTPVFYNTLQEAFDACVDIKLVKNTDEDVTVPAEFAKQLQLDMFRIQSTITNNGTIDIFSSISDEFCTGTIINNGSLKIRYADDVNRLQIVNNGKLEIVATNKTGVADLSTIINKEGGVIEISGGTFSTRPYNGWILWGYEAVDNGDGTFTVQKRTFADDAEALAAGAVAKYTSKSVTEYINTLANGGSNNLYFLKDIEEDVVRTVSTTFYAENFKYCGSLDATGMSVSFKSGKAKFNSLKSAALNIGTTGKEGVEVAIHDGKVTGKITVYSPAVLKIDGGTFTKNSTSGASYVVVVNSGARLIITGGTFKSDFFKPYIADGYEAVDNGDGTWSVDKTE